MLVNKVIICPICEKRTWIRIQAGYLKEYPIRVHCPNCHALMKGVYILPDGPSLEGLYMLNAKVDDVEVDQSSHQIHNVDYAVEISGELPCRITSDLKDYSLGDTPFMHIADYIFDVKKSNEIFSRFVKQQENWRKKKSIAFQLLEDGSNDYVAAALGNKMGEYTYPCDNFLKALHCLDEIILEETVNMYTIPSQDDSIKCLLKELSLIDRSSLQEMMNRIGGIESLLPLYKKTVEVFSSFMSIYPNVLPAQTYMNFKCICPDVLGISTCTYTDLKTYYQDAYESLLSMLFVPVCIDNIVTRGKYDNFNPVVFENCYIKGKDDFQRYLFLDNGWKLEKIQNTESIQKYVNLPANKNLRNGIGHNNIKYDGLSQTIVVYDRKNGGKEKYSTTLLQMSLDCIGLVKSAVMLGEIILFLMRQEYALENCHSILHPRFYTNTERNEKCPCGSNAKFKKCCQQEINQLKNTNSH